MSSSTGFVLKRRIGFTKVDPSWFENNKMLMHTEKQEVKKQCLTNQKEEIRNAPAQRVESIYESDSEESTCSTSSNISNMDSNSKKHNSKEVGCSMTTNICPYHSNEAKSQIIQPVFVQGTSYIPVVAAGKPYNVAVPVIIGTQVCFTTPVVATRISPTLVRF